MSYVLVIVMLCSLLGAGRAAGAPGGWTEHPGTALAPHQKPASSYPDYANGSSAYYNRILASGGFPTVMTAWNSAVLHRPSHRVFVWGGGHGDYAGNEVYAFDLRARTWARLTDPWLYVDYDGVCEAQGQYLAADLTTCQADQPRATHNYDTLVETDQGFCSLGMPATYRQVLPSPAALWIWCFDAGTRTWTRAGNINPALGDQGVGWADPDGTALTLNAVSDRDALDPTKYWVHTTVYGTAMYLCDRALSGAMTCRRKSTYADIPGRAVGVSTSQGFYLIGNGALLRGQFDASPALQAPLAPLTTTGPQDLVGCASPGVTYLPAVEKLVGWCGGGEVYSLDLATGVWTRHANAGALTPPAPPEQGTFGKFGCDAELGLCYALTQVWNNVFTWEMPPALRGTPPPVGALIPTGRTAVTAASSEDTVAPHPKTAAADGDAATFWESCWHAECTITPLPHRLDLDLGGLYLVDGWRYTPRQDVGPGAAWTGNGTALRYRLEFSPDGRAFADPLEGTFAADRSVKEVRFQPVTARTVRFTVLTAMADPACGPSGTLASAAEVQAYGTPVAPPLGLSTAGPVEIPFAQARASGVDLPVAVVGPPSPVTLTAAPPAGAFTPPACTPPCQSVFHFAADPAITPGPRDVVVTGVQGAATASTTLRVTVLPPPPPPPQPFANVGALGHRGPAITAQLSLWMPITGPVGDDVRATLRYKKTADADWRTGHPLTRVRPEVGDSPSTDDAQPEAPDQVAGFALPLFGLEAGTSYDLEVTLAAGAAREVRVATMATRPLPPVTGPVTKTIPLTAGLEAIREAVAAAGPGDVLEFAAGTFTLADRIDLRCSTALTAERRLTLRGAGTHATTLVPQGSALFFLVSCPHLTIENFRVNATTSGATAVYGWAEALHDDLVIRDNVFKGVNTAFTAWKADRVLVYNNWLEGRHSTWEAATVDTNVSWGSDGTAFACNGCESWENTYLYFGDCFAFSQTGHAAVVAGNISYHHNMAFGCHDDAVEADFGYYNLSVYDNVFMNTMTGWSNDTVYGGPYFHVRNIHLNSPGRQLFKWNGAASNHFTYNNTFVYTNLKNGPYGVLTYSNGNPQEYYGVRNNLFVWHGQGSPLYWESGGNAHVDWCYNGWYPDGEFVIQPLKKPSLAELQAALPASVPVFSDCTKMLQHDRIVERQPFADAIFLGADYKTLYAPIPFLVPDLRLKPGSSGKYAGTPIPGVTDGFSGAAPDLGAVIEGRPAVRYGARFTSAP